MSCRDATLAVRVLWAVSRGIISRFCFTHCRVTYPHFGNDVLLRLLIAVTVGVKVCICFVYLWQYGYEIWVPCAFCRTERWPKRLKVVVGANWHSCYGASWLTVPAYPTFKYLGASCCFRRYYVVLGNISKLRTYKTEKQALPLT
jgi:hypothetical protein